MKTILSFIDWYLPGYKAGGTLKAFANQVAHLDGFNFKIITRNTDYCETEPYTSVKADTWSKIAPNAEAFYASAGFINYGNFKKLVRETSFDAVYIHGVYSWWFSILPIILTKRTKARPIVVVAHGMFGKHATSVKSTKKSVFAALAKMLQLYKGVIIHAANEAEAADARAFVGKNARVKVAEELPMKMELKEWMGREKREGELKLLSVARISPEKNTRYAIEVLQNCTKGKITYDIYGPVYEQNYWNECLELIKKLPANVTVNYKGSLPGDQVLEKMKEYHFMFLPTTGENFGHTILESFMASTPIIISNKTPWQYLEQKQIGWSLPLDKMEDFSQVIEKSASLGQDDYDQMSQRALDFAWEFVNDKTLIEQNKRLFENE